MPNSRGNLANGFTFLNYSNPDHNAHHRRAVKSHISSKYRTSVRKQTQTRYALPLKNGQAEAEFEKPRPQQDGPSSPRTAIVPPRLGSARTPSPLEASFSGMRVNPFTSLPGEITPCVARALDYYVQGISALLEPLLVALDMPNPLMVWVYPLILSHESLYHGVVALSQACLENALRPMVNASAEVIFHRGKAVSLLRDQLSHLKGPPDDGILATVIILAGLDLLFRDDRVANRRGLALVVAMKGGLDRLGSDGLIKAFLIQFDYFWALEMKTESVFPATRCRSQRTYPQHPFDKHVLSLLTSMPPGFVALAHRCTLGVDVLGILSRVSLFLGTKADNQSGDKNHMRPFLGSGKTNSTFFEICASLQSSASTEHDLEKNLILAIILLAFDKYNPRGTHIKISAYRGSRKELTRSIPLTPTRNSDERACLMWLWMIVLRSCSEDSAPETASLGHDFFSRFAEARSWDYVEAVMRRFFWHEPLADSFKHSWLSAFDTFRIESACSCVSPVNGSMNVRQSQAQLTMRSGAPSHISGDGAVKQESTSTLPPMLTLETYLEDVR